ncbi:hypothetical protein Psal071_02654 [Piscirickettsia salmonis]|uniref:Uncharacterized protein n=1 Tax=Piscirickettsia salmonis TaxID=1238 RepID=A0A9Q6LNC3_PISSA|nr:hypothetical protein [Piscirickettsia salmonis]QGN96021.1 hypothetical protein Psal006a_02650 [Piscirickettsia salmonis]QGO06966.1 hypothetical protein Psal009_02902 [Piscirickettsia salmonis]QGO35293.1 hypothetical protein Psal028_02654 [Piscirickettsia salmonis]QGO38911.1 hypothetical protein Psal040_02662 [Piscirickettsia salmonis]QGO42526.1 hypothetical protein Psal041_02651 [Piscirickettsia salmonis]
MAKCPVCTTKKAKRACLITSTSEICPLCCGTKRNLSECEGCNHYQVAKRNYNGIPTFSPMEMKNDLDLMNISYVIESVICAFDCELNFSLNDSQAIQIMQCAIDHYYFDDQEINCKDKLVYNGFQRLQDAIIRDLTPIDICTLNKVLSTIHFLAKRQFKNGRDYLEIIRKYVGTTSGMGRLINI